MVIRNQENVRRAIEDRGNFTLVPRYIFTLKLPSFAIVAWIGCLTEKRILSAEELSASRRGLSLKQAKKALSILNARPDFNDTVEASR